MTPTFVLIHGSNANSFSWAPLQRELALLGLRSLAVDLPGHGFEATFPEAYQAPQEPEGLAVSPSSAAGITVADNVRAVTKVLRRIREHGPTIVIAHSRGGITLTALGNAVPELIDRMVYLSAWCCVDHTAGEYMERPEYAGSVLGGTTGVLSADPTQLGALRMNWRTADPTLLATLKRSMLENGDDDEFRTFLNLLQPDEALGAGGPDDRAQAESWGRVPHSYIRLTRDRSIPIELQDLFIAEADALTPDNRFDVHSLDVAHVEPLIHPAVLAAILSEIGI